VGVVGLPLSKRLNLAHQSGSSQEGQTLRENGLLKEEEKNQRKPRNEKGGARLSPDGNIIQNLFPPTGGGRKSVRAEAWKTLGFLRPLTGTKSGGVS